MLERLSSRAFWLFWALISISANKLPNHSGKSVRYDETVNNKVAWKMKNLRNQKNQTFLKYFF